MEQAAYKVKKLISSGQLELPQIMKITSAQKVVIFSRERLLFIAKMVAIRQ